MKRLYKPTKAPEHKDVLDAISYYRDNEDVSIFRKRKEKRYTEKIDISNLYMIEAMASKVTRVAGIPVFSADIGFLLWAVDYEYFSRDHVIIYLKFLSKRRQYEFFKRQVANGFVKMVRIEGIGSKSTATFYLTDLGYSVADKVYEVMLSGNANLLER